MRIAAAALYVAALAYPGASRACTFGGPPTEEGTRAAVERALRDSDAIIEAEVERDNTGEDGVAILRVVRLWKGPRQEIYRVSVPTSCSSGFGPGDVWGGASAFRCGRASAMSGICPSSASPVSIVDFSSAICGECRPTARAIRPLASHFIGEAARVALTSDVRQRTRRLLPKSAGNGL